MCGNRKEFGYPALFADDGVIWKRGRNVEYITKKIQEAMLEVEGWALEWGFRFSVSKTKAVIFTKRIKPVGIDLRLYGEKLEMVESFKYLGTVFDKRLTWGGQIEAIVSNVSNDHTLI